MVYAPEKFICFCYVPGLFPDYVVCFIYSVRLNVSRYWLFLLYLNVFLKLKYILRQKFFFFKNPKVSEKTLMRAFFRKYPVFVQSCIIYVVTSREYWRNMSVSSSSVYANCTLFLLQLVLICMKVIIETNHDNHKRFVVLKLQKKKNFVNALQSLLQSSQRDSAGQSPKN